MRYDIVMVTYNSEKWLRGCVQALASVNYPKEELHLVFADNASQDGTLSLLEQLRAEHPQFGGFTIVRGAKNMGFGAACNAGARAGSAGMLLFLNVDTAADAGVFHALDEAAAARPQAGGFECRQLPREMGHHFDPVTLETPWASGAAFCVRRPVFTAVGGFDEHIFMYCEDIDLSWRIRARGAPLYYVPQALVYHFVLNRKNVQASSLREYAGTQLGNLLLSYKYGTLRQMLQANAEYLRTLRRPQHFAHVRRVLGKQYLSHFRRVPGFAGWRRHNRALFRAAGTAPVCAAQHLLAPTHAPERGRFVLEAPVRMGPKFSVIVRTCSRPQSLRKTLQTLRWQTYRNFEVIVAEDGEPASRAMIEQEFSDLPIRYLCTGTRQGRGKNGNMGLRAAVGEYLNLLDDDDYFYPDHLELMAAKANEHPQADLILGCAMVMKVDMKDEAEWRYEVKAVHSMHFDRVDLFTMCQSCQIPIQSAVFKKSLFEACGGLHEDMEGNEDWFMWMRFLAKGRRIDPEHVDIDRATSVFVLPAGEKQTAERIEKYRKYNKLFYENPELQFQVSLADMRRFCDGMIADMQCMEACGKLHIYLENMANRDSE